MRISRNFALEEFACGDGTSVPAEYVDNVQALVCNLQRIRDVVGPLKIGSGFRTPEWNKLVGGAVSSQHLLAKAADLHPLRVSTKELHKVILKLIKQGHIWDGGVGLYATFVHYDIRLNRARWNG